MVATIRGWPVMRMPIESLRPQVEAIGGEILVMDGSDRPAPRVDEVGPTVRWVQRPGESVFQLRSAGYPLAHGDLVAITEDHCRPADDFVSAILRAHASNPDAIAVGGCIENGTPDHLVDWAAFVCTQGPFIPPLENGPADRIAGVAALAYKRQALDRMPDHGDFGAVELFDTASIRRDGETLVNDDRIRVAHYQSFGLAGSAAIQYHGGRAIAGVRRRAMARGDWLRILGFAVLPLYRAFRTIRIGLGRNVPRPTLLAAIPCVVLLHYSMVAGELVGYAAGPGDSPHHLF
jgi:hypothetical protein